MFDKYQVAEIFGPRETVAVNGRWVVQRGEIGPPVKEDGDVVRFRKRESAQALADALNATDRGRNARQG